FPNFDMATDLKQQLDQLRIDRDESVPEPSGRGKRIALALAAVVALAAVGIYLLRPRAVEVKTATALESGSGGAGGPSTVLNASGYVTARRQATVSSKITGKVEEVMVEEGMRVEAGQVLARLDDRQAQLSLGLAE